MLAVGRAATERGTALVLFVDELQYVREEQLAALIMALHAANQAQVPVTMVAAGLPQLLGQTGGDSSLMYPCREGGSRVRASGHC